MSVVIAKIGTSSLTDDRGAIDRSVIAAISGQVADLRAAGHQVVLVSSGAVAAGLEALAIPRPRDMLTKQVASAVGQSRLMRVWDDALGACGLVSGQVLLVPNDFFDRTQYLHARRTLRRMLEIGVVPVINENDAIADDELRFGDNDRIAALVGHLLDADVLVLLTDLAGLYSADPRSDPEAVLIESVDEITLELEARAGSGGTSRGSGGMASKLRSAKIASWSGVRAVIAAASRPGVLVDAVNGTPGVGTQVKANDHRLSARKLWIAFAVDVSGQITVDEGAQRALTDRGVSLLPAGAVAIEGGFDEGDAVAIAGPDGTVFARGLARWSATSARAVLGLRTADLPVNTAHELVHRDDLVIVPHG